MLEVEIKSKDFESNLDLALEEVTATKQIAVLTEDGKPVAYIVDIKSYEAKQTLLAELKKT